MARVKCPSCYHVNPDGRDECEQCRSPLPRIRIEAKASSPPGARENTISFHQGQLVAERYTVMNIIGRGGMGCIYKVHDRILGEEVALKTLLPQLVQDKLVVERFFNEARIARRLSHPHIVRVHDIGLAGETIYISMEYVRGHSLRALLEQCGPNQRLPLGRVLEVFEELCRALQYAHQFTVHRDIKPENVMIDEQGHVKLMDFGISKLMVADNRMTGASVVMGTPFYMAPEQFRNSRDVDARADIYSVGVMLYEVLTGVMPTGVPKPASEMREGMPPGLDAIVMKCVEPDPDKRFATAAEFCQALTPIRAQVAAGAGSNAARPKSASAGLPLKRIAGAVLALVVLLATGAAAYYAGLLMPVAPSAAAAVESAPEPQPFDAYASLVDRLKTAAIARADTDELKAAVDDANQDWADAEAARAADRRQEALSLAQSAFRLYAAALLRPEGMVFVPPGDTFVDGDRVSLDPYFIDTTEVSVGKFRAFAQAVEGGWRFPAEFNQYSENHPIGSISYFDALAFAAAQGKQIPSVAQWARAAYGADPQPYPWGDEWDPEACACLVEEDTAGTPAEVGSFEADRSAFGVLDMAGNVSEWTSSLQGGHAVNGQSPGFGTQMLVRGGNHNAAMVPLTESYGMAYEERLPSVGFRCVQAIPADPVVIEGLLQQL